MESRIDKTIERRACGFNCAQAIACTYCDLVGMDEQTIFRATEALGLGMGGMEGTCGALTSACILAGLKNSTGNLHRPDSAKGSLALSRELTKRFKERNGSVTCKELKGVETGEVLRTCPECIRDAAEFVEEVLFADK